MVWKDVEGSWVLDPRMSIFTRESLLMLDEAWDEKTSLALSPRASIGTFTLVPENLRRKLIYEGQGGPS